MSISARANPRPLHGIPILVKDVFETRGIPTSFGCRPSATTFLDDAEAVRRLRAAGAIILGKTATPDFAMSWLSDSSIGSTVNSRSAEHKAGGSSSGSAVAVAAGLAPVALGSDTGGSVRVPASFNGVVGMRPTTGLLPTQGLSTLVSVQDTPGPLTNCVDDAALLLDVLAGRRVQAKGRDGYRLGLLALPDGPMGWPGSDQVGRWWTPPPTVFAYSRRSRCRVCKGCFATVRRTWWWRGRISTGSWRREAAVVHRAVRRGVFPDGLDLAELLATRSSNGGRAELQVARRRLRDTVVRVMTDRGLDALVYPTVSVPAPRRDRVAVPQPAAARQHLIASQADLPALTLPAGATEEGLPVGLELLGFPGGDATCWRWRASLSGP